MTDTAETKPNGAAKPKPAKREERELTTLEGVVDLLGTAFRDQSKHVEQLVKAIEAPARVASSMLKTNKATMRELRRENKELRRDNRRLRDENEKTRADAWAREQYQLEFAHKIEMRGQILEFLKEKAPEIWAKHQESAVLSSVLKRVPADQLASLRTALKLSEEEWDALQKLRGSAPEEKEEKKENGNSQG